MLIDNKSAPPRGTSNIQKVEVSGGHPGLRLSVNAEAELKALVEIGQSLSKALAVNEGVLPKLLDSPFPIFIQADTACVVLREIRASSTLFFKAVDCRSRRR